MWNGKNKAITFSFDDGTQQDKKSVEILNKYNLKATFNLNCAKFGMKFPYKMPDDGKIIERTIINPEEVATLYKGHEIAVHTLTHPNLLDMPDSCVVWQIEEDRKNLERLVGYPVKVMAYPCGYINDHLVDVVKNQTQIKMARTVDNTYNFDLQTDLLRFNPTVHMREYTKMTNLAKEFLELKTDTHKLFFIWGHTYEFDMCAFDYDRFDEFCKMIANKDDIFYGTNSEVLF